jgi:hypothetical protein
MTDSAGDAAEVLDVLWAHAVADDGMEHIRVRAGPGRLDLILFIREIPGSDPRECAARLLYRAYRSSALLAERYLAPTPVP